MNPFIKDKKQLSIFVTAGYPTIDALPNQLQLLQENGVDFIEVGIPFSDPMADGPVIQKTSDIALENGMTLELLFTQLESVSVEVPLVMMSYFNPILNFGVEDFLNRCAATGVRHAIIPDLSLEVYEAFYEELFERAGVTLCFLVTPKTESKRIQKMAAHSSDGFIYLVSSNMTTGNSALQAPSELYKSVREHCGATPMMIGFGIRSKEAVEQAHQHADGAIIGSAYLQALEGGQELIFLNELELSKN